MFIFMVIIGILLFVVYRVDEWIDRESGNKPDKPSKHYNDDL